MKMLVKTISLSVDHGDRIRMNDQLVVNYR